MRGDGGPAFPRALAEHELRDWFAGQALAGMLASEGVGTEESPTWGSPEDMTAHAYRLADAMLIARTPTPSTTEDDDG
jgi:hypothetical protein